MKNRIRLIGIGLIGIFIIQSFMSPTTQVLGINGSTNFAVGDTFTFQMNKYDFVSSENGTDYLDIGNYTLVSLGEPIDVTVNNITETDPKIGENNVSTTLNFQNPSLYDPVANFTTLTDNWRMEIGLGLLISILLVSWFDPATTSYNESAEVQSDSITLPANTSFLFNDAGSELPVSFFVGNNDTFVNNMYDEYLLLDSDGNFTGNINEGFTNRSSIIEITDPDSVNMTEYIFQRLSWNNITKLLDFEMSLDMLNFGTFNSGSSYSAHSNFNFHIQADYNLGIVTFMDYYLLVETSVLDASDSLFINYEFVGDVYTPPVTTSSTTAQSSTAVPTISDTETTSSVVDTATTATTTTTTMDGTDTSNSAIDTATVTSSDTTATTTTTTRGLETSVSEVEISSSIEESPETSSDVGSETLPVNFSTPSIIFFSLLILTTNYRRRNNL